MKKRKPTKLSEIKKKISKVAAGLKSFMIAGISAIGNSLRQMIQKLNESNPPVYSSIRIILGAMLIIVLSISAQFIHSAYLLSKVGSNTVFIRSPEGAENQGSATGFEIKVPSGKVYTLTNAHVCGLQKNGIVLVEEKRHSGRLLPKRVIEVYEDADLCLVEGLEGYEGLSLASRYDIGDYNYAIGYPMGGSMNLSSGFLKDTQNVLIILPEIELKDCNGKHLKTTAVWTLFGLIPMCAIERPSIGTNITIFPGNSGSPMVNAFGNVTGVIFASNRETAWGDAVPLEYVKEFLKAY